MTEKQKRTIQFIEHELDITYKGTTDNEASDFIGKWLNKAKFLKALEQNMSIPVFSANEIGIDLDLKRDLSRELLIRDMQRGKKVDECMTNFAENLLCENIYKE